MYLPTGFLTTMIFEHILSVQDFCKCIWHIFMWAVISSFPVVNPRVFRKILKNFIVQIWFPDIDKTFQCLINNHKSIKLYLCQSHTSQHCFCYLDDSHVLKCICSELWIDLCWINIEMVHIKKIKDADYISQKFSQGIKVVW